MSHSPTSVLIYILAAPKAIAPGGKLKIMVAEDDPDVEEMLAALLTARGHEVVTALGGDEDRGA